MATVGLQATPRRRRCGLRARAGTARSEPPTAARSCPRTRRGRADRPGSRPRSQTPAVWPSSTRRHRPLWTSHSRTVLSADPERAWRPSGSRPRSRHCRCGLRAPAGSARSAPPTAARSCHPTPERARRPSGAPGHAPDPVGVAFEHPQAAAAPDLPQPHGLVMRRRRGRADRRAPGHAPDPGGVAEREYLRREVAPAR